MSCPSIYIEIMRVISWEDHKRISEGWAKTPPPHWKCVYGKMYYNHIIINSLLYSHPTTTSYSQSPVFAHGVHFSHKIGSPAEPCPGDRFSQANIPHNNLLFEIQNKINTTTRTPLQKKSHFFTFFAKLLHMSKKSSTFAPAKRTASLWGPQRNQANGCSAWGERSLWGL